jgi:hypothetical protein
MEAVVHDVTGSDQSVAVAGNTSTAAVASLDDLLVMREVAGNGLVELLGVEKFLCFKLCRVNRLPAPDLVETVAV